MKKAKKNVSPRLQKVFSKPGFRIGRHFVTLLILVFVVGGGIFAINKVFGQSRSKIAEYQKVISSSLSFGAREADSETQIPSDTPDTTLISPNLKEVYKHIEDRKSELTLSQSSNTGTTDSNAEASGGYPDNILPCTRNGDDLLVLVNKQYQLPSTYAPPDNVPVTNSGVRTTKSGLYVRNIIISDLTQLVDNAKAAGLDLAVLSAYRSYSTQQSTYTYWVNYNSGNTAAADTISARPGHSQHQLGTAVDFTTNEISDQLGQHFGNTAGGKWLAEHAWEYGFALAYPAGWETTTGYSYEPWHFRYIGVGNAQEWHSSGLILELWLREKN